MARRPQPWPPIVQVGLEHIWDFPTQYMAYTVLGQYLVLKKDEELFKDWMKDVCHASSKQALDCYNCLNDWCDEFL
ncbi:barrier-to-autointegration factor-like isoform X2 [Drosophila miranda]|uniref:barrier-to-autointegration factor-like isoform X2 n=1 Tax=Drosophila miranda TaxID=7229 RepID=UPI0007E89BBC|nr:barrier-to-autointegration factor-like isoform X2 [Drosophila miranda]